MGYLDVNDIGAQLRWREGMSGDTAKRLKALVGVAERRINNLCDRTFDLESMATRRWFEVGYADYEDGVDVDDFPHDSVTAVEITPTHPDITLEAVRELAYEDWYAAPLERQRHGEAWPASQIQLLRTAAQPLVGDRATGFAPRRAGAYPYTQFPGQAAGDVTGYLGVTATWGWPAVPAAVQEAGVLMVNRLSTRIDSPLGMVGGADYGWSYVRKNDPDIADLLAPYRRLRMM